MQAEREKVLRLMKTARGQMDGIIRMMEEDRYCIDISTQLLATEAILNKVNTEILAAHLKSCVADAKTARTVRLRSAGSVSGLSKRFA